MRFVIQATFVFLAVMAFFVTPNRTHGEGAGLAANPGSVICDGKHSTRVTAFTGDGRDGSVVQFDVSNGRAKPSRPRVVNGTASSDIFPSAKAAGSVTVTVTVRSGIPGSSSIRIDCTNPVVLVHGFTGSPDDMETLKTRFEQQGRPTFSIDLPSENNITNARAIEQLVAKVRSQTGGSQVDLVSHSMGGLSARYYMKTLGGGVNVAQYVSLGTPHYGVFLACLLPLDFGGQMCPASGFLYDLNAGDDTPGAQLYTTIYSTTDGTVPTSSSRLDGGACFVEVSGVSHAGLLTDNNVFGKALMVIDGFCPGVIR